MNLDFLCIFKMKKKNIVSDILHLHSPLPMLLQVTRSPFIKLLSDM